MISVWEAGIEERQPRNLKKDQSCQVVILGANLTGLFAALFCIERGCRVMILEEKTLEARALEIDFFYPIKDLKTWSYSIWYAWFVAKYHLKCNFKRMPAWYYWRSEKPTARMPRQPLFHPIRFIREIALWVDIYEEVEIMECQENKIDTSRAYVHYDHLIDARRKEQSEQEIWTAMEGIDLLEGMYLCMDGKEDLLMWKKYLIMREEFTALFPGGHISYRWEIDRGKKEGIYEAMDKAKKMVKNVIDN